MMRVDALKAPAIAGVIRKLLPAIGRSKSFQMRSVNSYIRFGIPLTVAAFAATMCFVTVFLALNMRDEIVADSTSEMELIASNLASELSHKTKSGQGKKGSVFERELPGRVIARGRQIIVADMNGVIVSSLPSGIHKQPTITGIIGDNALLRTFGRQAGVIQINLRDGATAIATLRTLEQRKLQLLIVHKLDDLLANWWDNIIRFGVLLILGLLLTSGISAAYIWQARRTEDSDENFRRLTARDGRRP